MSFNVGTRGTVIAILGLWSLGVIGTAAAQEESASPMMADCRSLMSAHREAKAEMKAAGEKLKSLVEVMAAAEGPAKMEAMEKVVSELVAQQQQTTSRMMAMQPRMMQHMMRHMQMGMSEGSQGDMACPMMEGMGGQEKRSKRP